MPEQKPRFIDPPQLFRSPRYTNVVVAKGFAFIAGQTAFDAEDIVSVTNYVLDRANLPLLVEVDAIVALPDRGESS